MIYYLLAGIIGINSFKFEKKINTNVRKKFYFCILWVIYGLRAVTVGADNMNYYKFFNNKHMVSNILHNYMEPGYVALNCIVHILFNNYVIFQFIIGWIFLAAIFYFIDKMAINFDYTLFMFIGIGMFFLGMNQVRESVAAVLVLDAYIMFKEKKMKRFFLFFCIAVLFHYSVLICILPFIIMYIVKSMKLSERRVAYLILIFSFFVFGFIDFFLIKLSSIPVYGDYYRAYVALGYIKKGHYNYLLFFGLLFFISELIEYKNKCAPDYGIIIWASIGLACAIISIKFNMIQRVFHYFQPFLALYASNDVEKIKSGKWRFLVRIIFNLLFLGFMYIYLYLSENGHGRDGVIPYELWGNVR